MQRQERTAMKTKFTVQEHTGSGLALALLLLLAGMATRQGLFYRIAALCILLLMAKPALLYPFTVLWLNLSDFAGRVMSRLLLAVIYFAVVLPVALVRRAAGIDTLQLRQFKKSNLSAFIVRNHEFTREDMANPF